MVNPEDAESIEGPEEGDFVTRKVQAQGRVNIPQDYLEYEGLKVGDEVIVIIEDDCFKVVESTKEKIRDLFMEEQ